MLLLAVSIAFQHHVLDTHRRDPVAYTVRREVRGFKLAEESGCADRDYCDAARPKAWTKAELDAIETELRRLPEPFLARLRRDGYDTLLRVTNVAHRAGNGWKAVRFPNTVYTSKQFAIADARFEKGSRPLLHVLAHAYDFGPDFRPSISEHPEFLELSGFTLDENGDWRPRGMTPAQRAVYRDRFAAVRPDERVARALGAPSFHALINPYEAFAEWCVAAWAGDGSPTALWVRQRVFSTR